MLIVRCWVHRSFSCFFLADLESVVAGLEFLLRNLTVQLYFALFQDLLCLVKFLAVANSEEKYRVIYTEGNRPGFFFKLHGRDA